MSSAVDMGQNNTIRQLINRDKTLISSSLRGWIGIPGIISYTQHKAYTHIYTHRQRQKYNHNNI